MWLSHVSILSEIYVKHPGLGKRIPGYANSQTSQPSKTHGATISTIANNAPKPSGVAQEGSCFVVVVLVEERHLLRFSYRHQVSLPGPNPKWKQLQHNVLDVLRSSVRRSTERCAL